MANPAIIACAKDAWTKVATNVQVATIWKRETDLNYYHTYRATGQNAPTTLADAVLWLDDVLQVGAASGIDVYVYAKGEAGEVRVDA